MYSQNNEEQIIKDFFINKKLGKFIDIGAFHPFTFSNTRCLYELGFKGVLVEPSPSCLKNIISVYENDANISILPYAVTTTNDTEVTFYDSNGDAISTTNKAHKNKWVSSSNVPYKKITVQCINIETLLLIHGLNTVFLSLDVEGENITIFNALPSWFLNRLQMICIEHDSMHDYIEKTLFEYGFNTCLLNNENIILKKQ